MEDQEKEQVLVPDDSDCLQSFVAHKKKRYYRYLGVDGRFHEIEEGKRVEVLPVGYANHN